MADTSVSPYTIGFFTTSTDSEYSAYLTHVVTQVAQERKINLINFLGGSLNPNYSFSQYKYQYQCNVAFSFAHTPHLDGIILASGALASFLDSNDFVDFYSQFKPTPMVSMGVLLPDLPSTYTDNKDVFYELVTHIIQVHHRKKIAFVSGPTSNTDAFERYLGYTSALSDNHIPYDSDYVYVGDFTHASGIEALSTLLDVNKLDIDAIVCANDNMALTILDELKKRNILVPEQIIVTGCDNLPSTVYHVPALTTIEQSFYDLAHASIDLLLDTINGKPAEHIIVPSKIIYRASCDCNLMSYSSSHTALSHQLDAMHSIELTNQFFEKYSTLLTPEICDLTYHFVNDCYELALTGHTSAFSIKTLITPLQSILKQHSTSIQLVTNLHDFITALKQELLRLSNNQETLCYIDEIFSSLIHTLFNSLLDYHSVQTDKLNQNFSFTRQFLLAITNNISKKEQQLQAIIPFLMEVGVTSCLIYLYPEGIKHNLSDTWKIPNDIYLYMGYVDNQIISPDLLPRQVPLEKVAFEGFAEKTSSYGCCLHPIFFGNEQLGVIVFEMGTDNYTLIDNLAVELGCALKLTSTFTTQRQVEHKLSTLSQTDELTNLLNRRGFFNLAQDKYDFSRGSNQNGILFYADMDGLKGINDTYGHHEGDFAIIAMSQILKNTFSPQDIVGRIGGDEFVILAAGQDTSYIERVTQKVELLCQDFNASHNKPYTLSISIGGIFYLPEDNESLEALLSRADQILYEKKRFKKSRKINDILNNDQYDLI